MRIALLLCTFAAAAGFASSVAAGMEDAPTELRITVWADGHGQGESDSYTLRCAPARGSLPKAAAACTKLLSLVKPFGPVARDAVCTDQYGGPQQALVTGTHKGRSVWAAFSATNGCQISRAKRVAFLLPGFAASAGA